ncbi:unnamed protein product [Nezara viridula]|uniref:ASD2 domain-containing protein n=1 Tax=Nezara viridula TaxID=85310 RepID=A0A9P0GW40_NEZVI|nr:unnamed protein product [Nezara viridula]
MSPSGGRIIETALDKPIEKVPDASQVSDEEKLINETPKEEKQPAKTEEESPSPNVDSVCERDIGSKTLPRGYPIAGPAKRGVRTPRAQSDPTCSTKVEKKTVSASTQDNLDEIVREEKPAVVGRSQSDRTETRVRVEEPRVSDASSQTTPTPSPPPTPPRRHLQEEIECDQLSRDLASQLSPSHKLHGILVPGPDVKRSTDYVSGLFRMDFAPRSRSSLATSQTTTSITTNTTSATNTTPVSQNNATQQTSTIKLGKESESPSPNNTYFTTPECKARLLSTTNITQIDNTAPSSIGSLQQKKEELMMRLSRKLLVLKAESVAVTEETAVNEALGNAVCERVERVARPHEVSRFKLHVKEVGHITSLLLSLSGRLARAENGLLVLPPEHPDRKALEEKRDKLLAQLNEAKQLKSNIDQRSGSVSSMLYNYLTGEEYTDYDHFINMKSKLLVDSREIAEKIQLGEEQLAALKETLDQVR